jgi:MFS family permease
MRRSPWWVVFGSTLGLVVGNGPIAFFTFGLFLKPVTSEFHWDRATFAMSLLVGHTLAALAFPFIGRLVDRYGIRPVTLIFITLFALSTASIALTPPSPAVFIALSGLCGLLSAGQAPPPYAKAISAWFDDKRGVALGIAMAGIGIGATLVPQLARRLIDGYGWRTAYVGLGIATFVVAFPAVALFVREPGRPARLRTAEGAERAEHPAVEQPSSSRPLRSASVDPALPGLSVGEAMRTSSFWIITVSVFLTVTTVNGMIGHLVPLLTDRGISVQRATATLSAVGLSVIGGRLVAGVLLDRLFAGYVAAGLFLLPIVAVVLLASGAVGAAPALAAMFLGFGLGSEVDVIGFLVGRYFGLRAFGEIYGYLFAIFTLGTGFGPVLMAVCFDLTKSYNTTLGGFAAALLVASILITRLGPYTFPATRAMPVVPARV